MALEQTHGGVYVLLEPLLLVMFVTLQQVVQQLNSVANNVANVYLGGGGAIGAGFHFDASKTATTSSNMVYQAYSSNYMSPQLILTYTPGADTDAPTMVSEHTMV